MWSICGSTCGCRPQSLERSPVRGRLKRQHRWACSEQAASEPASGQKGIAMFPTRRDFLKSSSLVAWGLTVPGFVAHTGFAAPDASQSGSKESILVIVELTGGNDGLNTVVPFKDPEYAKYRPTLKLNSSQLKKVHD